VQSVTQKKVYWRVLIDLADFAKREARLQDTKFIFKLISTV
jgi:hypothetical protein